jgi:SAM-dependent methyltransferase
MTTLRHRTTCRLCGQSEIVKVLELVPTPPANAFADEHLRGKEQPCFPLDLFFCCSCSHIQLLDIVDPEFLFSDYVYVSGTSPVFQKHFEMYASEIIHQFSPPDGSLVIDIGSNDGTLLTFFKGSGFDVLGIDPAKDIALAASHSGIDTLPAFFQPEIAARIQRERGAASVITANNVFAHIDDLCNVMEGIRILLAPDGILVFEVSYLLDVFEKTLFDTIYHEHLDYHSVKPLLGFFDRLGFELIEAQRVESHGGSLRGIVQLKGAKHPQGNSVKQAIENEERVKLDEIETFYHFSQRIEDKKQQLSQFLQKIKSEGKSIAGYGAPAKATTLMFHFGMGPDIIDFIVDDSPLKQGLFTPGSHIPVLPSDALKEKKPDYLLILAWNFADPIIKKNKDFHDDGGRFIIPLPDLRSF